jgi:hypothetical protein
MRSPGARGARVAAQGEPHRERRGAEHADVVLRVGLREAVGLVPRGVRVDEALGRRDAEIPLVFVDRVLVVDRAAHRAGADVDREAGLGGRVERELVHVRAALEKARRERLRRHRGARSGADSAGLRRGGRGGGGLRGAGAGARRGRHRAAARTRAPFTLRGPPHAPDVGPGDLDIGLLGEHEALRVARTPRWSAR